MGTQCSYIFEVEWGLVMFGSGLIRMPIFITAIEKDFLTLIQILLEKEKMNKMLVLMLLSMQVTYIYCQCSCSELSSAECTANESQCTGGADCKDLSCADLKEGDCRSFWTLATYKRVSCYWDGDSCESHDGESCDYTFTTAEAAKGCENSNRCKVDPDDDKKCTKITSCTDITKDNQCRGINQTIDKICYWDVDKCTEFADCKAIGVEGTDCEDKSDGDCAVVNGECAIPTGTETTTEIKACADRTEAQCPQWPFKNEGKGCVWFTGDKKCVELAEDHSCADRADETFCPLADSCKWDASACKDKVCADYTTECTYGARAFEVQGQWEGLFCKGDSGACADAEAKDLGDKCYERTGGRYSWDGSNCNVCSKKEIAGSSNSTFLIAIVTLLLAFVL